MRNKFPRLSTFPNGFDVVGRVEREYLCDLYMEVLQNGYRLDCLWVIPNVRHFLYV